MVKSPSLKMALKMKNTYDSTGAVLADEFDDMPNDAFYGRQTSLLSQPYSTSEPDLEEEPQMQKHKETGECWDAWRVSDGIPEDGMEGLLAAAHMASLFPFGHMPNMSMSPWMSMFMPPMLPMSGGSHMGMPSFPTLTSPTPKDSTIVHTVMMRNLPNKYTQQMLIDDISLAGFAGTFDFFYLPIDPETHANRGYAFINFENPINAHYFMEMYEGRQMHRFDSKKFVSCTPATLQGFDANYSHYANARVSRGELSSRPLFLRQPQPQAAMPVSAIRGSKRRGRRDGTSSIEESNRRSEETYVGAPTAQFQTPFSTPSALPAPAAKAPVAQPMRVEEVKQSKKRFCAACGGKRAPEDKFCEFCGCSLP